MKAMRQLGRFAGEDDVEWWIDRFQVALRIDGVTEEKEADMLIMQLDGPAYDTWRGLPARQQDEAGCIKAALRRVFGKSRFEAWAGMAKDSAAPGEPLAVYAERLRTRAAVALAGGDPADKVCALMVLDTLPVDVRDKVVMQLGEDITLDRVVSTANLVKSSPTAVVAAEARRPAMVKPPAARAGPRCFRCGQLGHFIRSCPVLAPGSGRQDHSRKYAGRPALNELGGSQAGPAAPRM